VFVSEINFPGSALLYSTLLSGSLTDSPAGIAVDGSGNAYVTGYTQSSDFPTANALQAGIAGGTCGPHPCSDAFVTEVNPLGSSLVYSTYLGGSSADFGNGIALWTNPSNNNDVEASVVGTTTSPDFPAISLAFQGEPGNSTGLGNAFISRVYHNNLAGVALTPQTLAFGNVSENTTSTVTSENVPATIILLDAGTVPLQVTSIATTGDFAETDNCVGTIPAGGGRCTINVKFSPTVLVAETEQLTIKDNAAGSPHLVTLTGTGVTGATTVQFTPTSLVFQAENINVTSPPQTVTMTNNGDTPLTVTNITANGDFSETTNCPATPFTLPQNGSCLFQITFTPTSTGVIKGSLNVTDNVVAGTSAITLTGTGNPVFSLNSPTPTQMQPIGTTSTTFTISLSAPSTFTDPIRLSCATGTCSFNPQLIALGSTTLPSASTMTLSGLSASSTNPYLFSVNGTDSITSTSEVATLPLTVFLQDFSLSASPAINLVSSGGTTIYTVTVSPINGFSQPVALSCIKSSLPQGALCLANPAALTPNGGAVTSQLSVSTTAQSTSTSSLVPRARPRTPPGPMMLLVLWGICNLMALSALLVRRKMGHRGTGRRKGLIYAQVALAALVLAAAFWVSCDQNYYTNVIQPSTVNGTPTGNYVIAIQGAFTGSTEAVNGISTTVTHTTSVNLTVQ